MTPITRQLTRNLISLATAGLLALPALLQAQPTAHYVPGVEGIKGASLPPPGMYLRDYNVLYYSDRLNDQNGDKIGGVDANALIYANVPRFLWITDAEVLGGFIGVDALLPLQYTDLDIKAGPNSLINDSTFGIGDLFAETTWSKHIKQFEFSLAAGFWAPTGDSAAGLTTRAGQGFWTGMFTAGATWYPDAKKLWSISALNRYEINSEKQDANYTPGQAYTLEWGVGRSVSKTVEVGVAGYYQQQVTEDSGSGKTTAQRDRVAGAGPEVTVFYPRYKLGWSLRYAYEFMAESRLQGHTGALTITKIF
jgi:hypothetical protein